MKPLPAVPVLLAVCVLLACSTVAHCAIIHVRTDGDDSLDGLSWAAAKKTVQAGIDTASAGDEVWVVQGAYVGCIVLKDRVGLYGGFAGDEEARQARDSGSNPAVLDGNWAGTVVTVLAGTTTSTIIDGFTIRNGNQYPSDVSPPPPDVAAVQEYWSYGGGVYCAGSVTISNNTITENLACCGGGIYCEPDSSPTITDNDIVGNWADTGGGICCYGAGVISNNLITANDAGYGGGGIYCGCGSSPTISGNTLADNEGGWYYGHGGAGIGCEDDSSPVISGNLILGGYGDGISCGPAIVTNNTISGTDCGIYCYSSSAKISNNIVAFNGMGIASAGDQPILRNNDVYNPNGTDYSGLAAGAGDISADPRFARVGIGNYHIQPDSPCRNAGWNDAPGIGSEDMDGQPRVQGDAIDVGADESDGTVYTYVPVTVRVSADGDDANDGSSWTLAKKTVQAGINAAAPTGGEVWVRAGTYGGNLQMSAYVSIYGGFAGTEDTRPARNWSANKTILEGDGNGAVVTVSSGHYYRFSPSAIDGFTIRNGSTSYDGAGVSCRGPVAIANNLITANKAVWYGGAVHCSGYALISNNVIFANGGGVYLDGGSHTLTNNTIVGNRGAGIDCYSSHDSISNNIVAFNSCGIFRSERVVYSEPQRCLQPGRLRLFRRNRRKRRYIGRSEARQPAVRASAHPTRLSLPRRRLERRAGDRGCRRRPSGAHPGRNDRHRRRRIRRNRLVCPAGRGARER